MPRLYTQSVNKEKRIDGFLTGVVFREVYKRALVLEKDGYIIE